MKMPSLRRALRRTHDAANRNPRVIALAIVAGVVGVLLLADLTDKVTGGRAPTSAIPQTVTSSAPASPATTDPGSSPATSTPAPSSPRTTAADDGDDGIGDAPTTQPTIDPAATETATAFTAAWLNTLNHTDSQWRNGLFPYVTADLAGELLYADPETVPDGGHVGTVKLGHDGQLLTADVQIVTAAGPRATLGTLHLAIVPRDHDWLISAIDWAGSK